MRTWRRLKHDRRAVAAVETGVVLAFFLAPLLAGVTGVGQAMLTQYRVDRATHAGLMAAWYAPTTVNAVDVQQAALSGYGTANGDTLTPVASFACYCVDPAGTRTAGSTVPIACNGTCTSSSQVLGKWVTLNSTASFTPILFGSWSRTPWTLSASSTVRIK